jgi:hypothetical protein
MKKTVAMGIQWGFSQLSGVVWFLESLGSIVEESAQRKRTAHLKPAVTPPTRLAAMAGTISTSPSQSQP